MKTLIFMEKSNLTTVIWEVPEKGKEDESNRENPCSRREEKSLQFILRMPKENPHTIIKR